MSSAAAERCNEREPTYPRNNVYPGASSCWMLKFQFMTYARWGKASIKRFRIFCSLKLTFGLMPVPSVAAGAAPMIWKGAVAAVFKPNSYGSGSTSNVPKPARTTVFPFLNGSQSMPMRGSKFLVVGFFRRGLFTPIGPHAVGLDRQLDMLTISWKPAAATL